MKSDAKLIRPTTYKRVIRPSKVTPMALKIKELRLRKGASQEDFGKVAGVSASAVSLWERGVTQPKNDSLNKLSREYKVDLASFVDDSIDTVQPKKDSDSEKETGTDHDSTAKILSYRLRNDFTGMWYILQKEKPENERRSVEECAKEVEDANPLQLVLDFLNLEPDDKATIKKMMSALQPKKPKKK